MVQMKYDLLTSIEKTQYSGEDLNCGLTALVRAALTACSRFDGFLRLSKPES